MPHPENDRGPWIYANYRVFLSWPFLLFGLVLGVTGILSIGTAEAATLNELRIGNHGDYIRIVFELSDQAQYQLNQDTDANKISVRFLKTNTTISENLKKVQVSCLEEINTLQQDDQIVAHLHFNSRWHRLDPFPLREPDRIVLDVFCGQGAGTEQTKNEYQLDQTAEAADTAPEKKPDKPDSISTLTNPESAKTETAALVSEEPPVIESTTSSTVVTESPIQISQPKPKQTTKPVTPPKVAPQKEDPFQKYLLILLAAITGIIVMLIALIVIQKKSQSTGSGLVTGNAQADPDEAMHAIDQQIKAKLMKYDDQ